VADLRSADFGAAWLRLLNIRDYSTMQNVSLSRR
jgi:hypothetical protein